MPMAISLFAAGVIWRIMDQQEPEPRRRQRRDRRSVHDAFEPPGVLPDALAVDARRSSARRRPGSSLKTPLEPGRRRAARADRRSRPSDVPAGAKQAVAPAAEAGRDHGRRLARLQAGRRQARQGRAGRARACPACTVELRDAAGKKVADGDDRRRRHVRVRRTSRAGSYHAAIGADDVRASRSAASLARRRS